MSAGMIQTISLIVLRVTNGMERMGEMLVCAMVCTLDPESTGDGGVGGCDKRTKESLTLLFKA